MAPALLIALGLFAAGPATEAPATTHPAALVQSRHAIAKTPDEVDDGDIPPGAPTDDYGFVAWCYGALSESLTIYDQVKPDLKAIDEMFGTSVQEPEPYMADVAAERVALKRFGDAIEAGERSSAVSISLKGAADIQSGRGIWSLAKLQPHRKLADAWLFWGIPRRCETAAKSLIGRPAVAQAGADTPSAIALAANQPAPEVVDPSVRFTPPPPVHTGPPAPPRRSGAEVIDSN